MKQINNPKLTIITRKDLKPGYQLVQSVHAAIEFIFQYPEESLTWHFKSNHLACLSVNNESCLLELIEKLKISNIKYSIFKEPDIDNEITAIAIEPNEKLKKLCSNLPLALKEIKI